jgi:tRNA threonylcarbamoyladenosine biosynthesis protein TsaE
LVRESSGTVEIVIAGRKDEMSLSSPVQLSVPTADDMHAVGLDLARLVREGDLIILIGDLGAGKTRLAQGIGEGMKVEGPVISPTFVISRFHPSTCEGLAMLHVDAYRLTNSDEVEDLDLEAYMPTSVTIVEWGRDRVEYLNENRLEIEIQRCEDIEDDTRLVTITAIGERWNTLLVEWEQLVNDDMGRDGVLDAGGRDDV